MKHKIELHTINFKFTVDGVNITVNWQFLGRGYVGAKEYPSTYKVYVNHKDGFHFTTSYQANITNSRNFLDLALKS